jgi:FKBP-type peptidyl-prolyl cis-trans isomerase FkpA
VAAGGKSSNPEIKLDNGLIVQELVMGKGNSPNEGDLCTVHYSLYYNGDEIESSRESSGLAASPIGFQYGVTEGSGSVIPALALGVQNMKVGGVRRITAPPEMAFGKKGRQGGRVPPGATVQFDVQLLTVKRRGTNPISSQGRGSEKNTGLFDLF